MKRKFQVVGGIEDKSNVEYNITVKKKKDGTVFTLSYSDSPNWTSICRGKKILRLIDDGNGVTIESLDGINVKNGLDYGQFTEVRILMDFVQKYGNPISGDFKVEEVKDFCEV